MRAPVPRSVQLVARTLPQREERILFEPSERRGAILHLIGAARERLILSLFRCTDCWVLGALAAAVRRGVRVDALLTARARGWRKKLEGLGVLLESMGVHVQAYRRAEVKYHAKYIVADDALALVSSLNFTRKCFHDTCDFILTTSDAGVVAGLQALFEADCHGSAAPFSEGISGRLIVGPERGRAGVERLLMQARRRIRIVDHRISDPRIVALLESRRAAGIAVETLERHDVGDLVSHGKLILIDDASALIGSMALSTASLDSRRELAIVIRDPHCVRSLSGVYCGLADAESPGRRIAS